DVTQIAAEDAEFLSSIQSADGTLYIASWNSTSNRSWVSKLSPDGQLLWRQQLDGTTILQGTLALNSNRLCWRGALPGELDVECHATSDGRRLWTYGGATAFALLDDDTVVVLQLLQSDTMHELLDANGQVLAETTDVGRSHWGVRPEQIAFAKDGTVAVSDLQDGGAIF